LAEGPLKLGIGIGVWLYVTGDTSMNLSGLSMNTFAFEAFYFLIAATVTMEGIGHVVFDKLFQNVGESEACFTYDPIAEELPVLEVPRMPLKCCCCC
jgi:hypothetical protein